MGQREEDTAVAALPPQPPGYQTAPPQPPPAPPSVPPGGAYASQMPQPAYAGGYAPAATAPAPGMRRTRTGMILFAQILMILKGIIWLLGGLAAAAAGVFLIVRGASIRDLPGVQSYANAYGASIDAIVNFAAALVLALAVVAIVIGVVDLILGVTVGRPSNVARWLSIVVTVFATLAAVSGLVNSLADTQRIGGAIFFAVWLGINAVIFYALAIDARSRRAFG